MTVWNEWGWEKSWTRVSVGGRNFSPMRGGWGNTFAFPRMSLVLTTVVQCKGGTNQSNTLVKLVRHRTIYKLITCVTPANSSNTFTIIAFKPTVFHTSKLPNINAPHIFYTDICDSLTSRSMRYKSSWKHCYQVITWQVIAKLIQPAIRYSQQDKSPNSHWRKLLTYT